MTKRIPKIGPQSSALASKRVGIRARSIGYWMRGRTSIACGFWFLLLLIGTPISRADKVDEAVSAEMQKHRIRGLSLAIIEKGDIATAKGYGSTQQGGRVPVTTSTLFQAGSVSKPVAALGALHLVEQGKLSLDEDVNRRLTTWKVPEKAFLGESNPVISRSMAKQMLTTQKGEFGLGWEFWTVLEQIALHRLLSRKTRF